MNKPYRYSKPKKVLENKKRILQQKNNRLLKELYHCFQQHQIDIHPKYQLTFKHEYGHVKEALELGFTYSLIALLDKHNKKHHLFYLKDGKIKYGYIIMKKIPNTPRGISYFYSNFATNTDWKKVAIGGFISDMLLDEKSHYKSKDSFGDTTLSKLFSSTSDYKLLKRLTNDPAYHQELNVSFISIHNYLYSDLTNKKPKTKVPLEQYRQFIQTNINTQKNLPE